MISESGKNMKCKESGKDEEICHAELAKACKDLAIGMKHSHGE